jgi:hypothetical protein
MARECPVNCEGKGKAKGGNGGEKDKGGFIGFWGIWRRKRKRIRVPWYLFQMWTSGA